MILYQLHLAGALPVPVFLSSLLQLPFIRRILGPGDRIGIITANALHLTPRHLRLAGLEDAGAAKIIGLEDRPAFREAIFGGSGSLDYRAVQEEVVGAARELIQGRGRVKAILLECSNLPPLFRSRSEGGRVAGIRLQHHGSPGVPGNPTVPLPAVSLRLCKLRLRSPAILSFLPVHHSQELADPRLDL